MIFSYVPLYNLVFSVQRTCLAWKDLCLHRSLWKEVRYYKEFDERLTNEELLSVLKQVSTGIKQLSIEKAFKCREKPYSFSKFLQCILHENVDLKNISSLKIPSIPNEYIEPLLDKCSGLSSIEVSYMYEYADGNEEFLKNILGTIKKLTHLKEFKLTKSVIPFNHTKFNELLVDMFSGLLELEVVHIDCKSSIGLYDSTLSTLFSKCKNLRELALYGCYGISNAGFESLPDKSGITSLRLISAGINDDGMEHICRSCPNLRELSFAGCRYVTDISVFNFFYDCPNLESLCISDPETVYRRSNITGDGLELLFESYRSLRSPILCNNADALHLNVDLFARSCINLVHLDVSGCKSITDDTLRNIAECCTNLQTVNLSKCFRLRGGTVNMLVTSFKWLKTLNVARCRFLEDLNFEAFDQKNTPFNR